MPVVCFYTGNDNMQYKGLKYDEEAKSWNKNIQGKCLFIWIKVFI